MTFRWTLITLLSWWRRHPGQLAALFAGLALATALWSAVQALNLAARDSYAQAADLLGGGAVATLARPEGGAFDQALFVALRRAGVLVSPVLDGRVRVAGRSLRLIGVEPVTLPPGGALTTIGAEGGGDLADLLATPRRALIAPETLRELGLAEGATPLTDRGALPALQPREGLAPGTVIVDIGEAQRLTGARDAVTRLILPSRGAPPPERLAALTNGALTLSGDDPDADLGRLTESFHLNLTAFGLLAFVVGLFIAHAAVGLAFEQRLGTVRTLRACGVEARTVALALLAEAAALALLAGVVGMAAGYALAAALAPDVAASLRGLYGAPGAGELRLSPAWWLSGLGMAVAGALVAAGAGIWRAARLPLLAPAQSAAWLAAHEGRMRRMGWAAVGLLALAALIARSGEGLAAGFSLLACLLVGAALAAPPLLSALLRAGAARARTPVGRWLWADGRAGLGGLSLALMALMLALAANIGVGTMVTGFRATFEGWLENRLAAEIYARPRDPAQEAALREAAGALPAVRAVLPSLAAETRIGGWPVEVLGVADHPTYRDRWPVIEADAGAWDRIAAGQGALVSEQLARRLRIERGETVTLAGRDGPWLLTVVGLHPDYGNPRGQIVVALDAMAQRMPQAAAGAWGLRVADGQTGTTLAALAADPRLSGMEMIDQTEVKRVSLGLFDRTFAVTAALNALTLGVAGVALLASLTTLSAMRLPQLAPLWAMGLTRAQLARLDFARTMALALLTAALAVPVGVALAWALVAVVNVQAFGWRLPLHLYPGQWLRLALLAALVAAAAAAIPALRLRRTPPARLLATFAQER